MSDADTFLALANHADSSAEKSQSLVARHAWRTLAKKLRALAAEKSKAEPSKTAS